MKHGGKILATNYPTSIDSYSAKVDGVDDVLAAHINDPQDAIVAIETALGVAAWNDWTPTITQSGAVSISISYAKYKIINKMAIIIAQINMTGAGTGGNDIVIGNIPAAIQSLHAGGTITMSGFATVLDSGTTIYVGSLIGASASTFKIIINQNAGYLGSIPNLALASGDSISLIATHRVA